MPLFCVHGLDHPDADDLRLRHYAAHRAFLKMAADWGVTIAASGPLMSDDGERMIGSLFLVEAECAAAVASFNAADPFAKAGLWQTLTITRFGLRLGSIGPAARKA